MSSLKTQFERDGYVVVPSLLTRAEADFYRAEIVKLSGIGDAQFGKEVFECPDGVSKNRVFWPLITKPELIATLRELLGSTIRYTQHSDLHAHRGGIAWHRDSACRAFGVGPDWDETEAPYQITRVAIYLQTYAESKSSLGVIPGSHRFERRPTPEERERWNGKFRQEYRIKTWLNRFGLGPKPTFPDMNMLMWTDPNKAGSDACPTLPVWVNTEPGDCIIFNQRLFHSASPMSGPKYAVYLSYATDNQHAENHLRYYRYARKDLNYGPLEPELAELLQKEDLFLDVPAPAEVEGFTIPAG